MKRPVFALGMLALLLVLVSGCAEQNGGLYLVELDGTGHRQIAGEDAYVIGWLDQNVALVWQDDEVRALDIGTGTSRSVLSGPDFTDVQLSPGGERIAYLSLSSQGNAVLHVMKADGSDDRVLAESPALNRFSWSPDSERLVYTLDPGSKNYVIDVSGEESPLYVASGSLPSWAPCERIIVLVSQGRAGWYAASPDGSGQVFLGKSGSAVCHPKGEMIALDWPGAVQLVTIDGRGLGTLTTGGVDAWSPDGSKLAAHRDNDTRTLVVVELESHKELNLVSTELDTSTSLSVCWSLDGKWLAFSAKEATDLVHDMDLGESMGWDIYVAKADGSEVRAFPMPEDQHGCKWTPDGKRILVHSVSRLQDGD